MRDFYDMATPPEKRGKPKSDKSVSVCAVALLIVLAAGFIILRLAGYKTRVRDFRIDLNNSTIYAYNNDCLRARVEGDDVHVSGEHAYDVYQFMSVRSLGANALFTPRQGGVILEYGDGAVLRLWEDKDGKGMLIRFDSADGDVCRFHSRDMRLRDLVGRFLALSKNAPWEE